MNEDFILNQYAAIFTINLRSNIGPVKHSHLWFAWRIWSCSENGSTRPPQGFPAAEMSMVPLVGRDSEVTTCPDLISLLLACSVWCASALCSKEALLTWGKQILSLHFSTGLTDDSNVTWHGAICHESLKFRRERSRRGGEHSISFCISRIGFSPGF